MTPAAKGQPAERQPFRGPLESATGAAPRPEPPLASGPAGVYGTADAGYRADPSGSLKHGYYTAEAIEARRLAGEETWEQAKARLAREDRRRGGRERREMRNIIRELNRIMGKPGPFLDSLNKEH